MVAWKALASTIDRKILLNFSSTTFADEKWTQIILCNVWQPVWSLKSKLDYTKILQVKYFTGENIPV